MSNTLTEAIETLKQLPELYVEKALKVIREINDEHKKEAKSKIKPCPECESRAVVRNGHKCRKQSFLCRRCGKSFTEISKTALCNSHSGEAVWKQVIKDTVNGISIEKTANNLYLQHETVFNMRHKILLAIEEEEHNHPTKLLGICEADETYLLESYKGNKLSESFWRKSRKHGAVAKKPGLSDEYICICAGVERDGNAIAKAVNRANAGKDDIDKVFSERVTNATLLLSDGAKAYGVLEGKCKIHATKKGDIGFYNINTVNNYHSFIKERNRNARGFATKYLNRYNYFFSKIFRKTELVVDQIYDLLCDINNHYHTNKEIKTMRVLKI